MTDQIRWEQFMGGDQAALSQIFLEFHDDLFNYGMKLSANDDIVKDSIQDLFLKLWKNRQNLDKVKVIKPYLFKSLRHHIFDSIELRKSLRLTDEESNRAFEVVYSHEDFLIDEQINTETRDKVIQALNQLTPRQREAIYLRYFEELEFSTVAQVMEMNVQSVRNTIHRGMQVMRDLMVLHVFFLMLGKSADFFRVPI
ncbi:MAG TPA: RNA polymerase sigma factor [Bacteroidales bacterium]